MKKIIYCASVDGNPNHLETIHKLKQLENWEPAIIAFPHPLSKLAKNKYPKTFVTDDLRVRQGNFDDLEKNDLLPLEKNVLDDLKIFQTRYFDTLEDTTGWNYSYQERKENFYETFKFWYSVISIVLVFKSISAQTIFAPFLANGIAEAQYVCAGIMTSSFFFKSNKIEINSNAAAAELTA